VEDVEPFIEWLQSKGLSDEAHLAAYRRIVAELAQHPSLSAALRAAEEAGKPPREIANMRAVAGRIAEFEQLSAPAPAPRPSSPSRPPVEKKEPALEVEPAPRAAAALAVEPRTTRPPLSRMRDSDPPRKGCICKRRSDVYLDDDFGALARLFGGGIGIGTIVLIRLLGVLGALTLAFGAAAMGGLVTITSICMRCETCRHRVSDTTDDERARIRTGRGRVVVITLILLVAAAACGAAWWSIIKDARTPHLSG
jgi:hypothetical protein